MGDPTLRAKSIVEVRGISGLLSGKYYVQDVKHVISASGYVCDLKLTRDGTGRRRATAPQAQRQQGGSPNRTQPGNHGAMTQVEVIDPESGGSRIEYRPSGAPIGAGDPEAAR